MRHLAEGSVEIRSIESFLDYYESVRRRTTRVVERIPDDRMAWRHPPGRFSFADLVRHLAAIERWMFAENVAGRPLRAMVEHEVHHRGQLCLMLGMVGASAPPMYGLTSEQVRAASIPAGPPAPPPMR